MYYVLVVRILCQNCQCAKTVKKCDKAANGCDKVAEKVEHAVSAALEFQLACDASPLV